MGHVASVFGRAWGDGRIVNRNETCEHPALHQSTGAGSAAAHIVQIGARQFTNFASNILRLPFALDGVIAVGTVYLPPEAKAL